MSRRRHSPRRRGLHDRSARRTPIIIIAAVATPLLLTALFAACAPSGARVQGASPSPTPPQHENATLALDTKWTTRGEVPTLVLFIAIDQFRAEYLDRFGGQFTGGLGRLVRGGAVFTNAFHDHGITETAPGHSTMLSGRFPRSTGITMNDAGVPDAQYPLVGAPGAGASPYRFRGTTLIDWLRFKDARSRALSVSRKDRAAILPLGRAKQEVYWYAPNAGRFTTSTYYRDTLPSWVTRFNERRIPFSYAGKSWTPLLPASAYPERDSVPVEHAGRDVVFPHAINADSTRAAREFIEFPWMDQFTLNFALDGVNALKLGAGPATDVLAISLSTTDAVGHRYGPDSRELHDQVLQLDRSLGAFLDSLFVLRDSMRVVIAVTSDHGVTSFPDLQPEPKGVRVTLTPLITATRTRLQAAGVARAGFTFDDGVIYVDPAMFEAAHLNADSVGRQFATEALQVPGVMRVDLYHDLLAKDTVHDVVARRWLHMFPPDVSVLLTTTLKPNCVWSSVEAQHGSPHDIDAQVPIIFYGPAFTPGRYADTVRVVDIAPTLARVTHTVPGERLDGRVLERVFR
jgi:hypothetical protein